MPSGDATQAFDELNEILKQAGIFIVPVGELECFVIGIREFCQAEQKSKRIRENPDTFDSLGLMFYCGIDGKRGFSIVG